MKFLLGKCSWFCLLPALMLLSVSAHAETTLVGWTFPETNLTASAGIDINTNQTISAEGGAEIVTFVNGSISGTLAPSAGGWADGSGSAHWLISFSTANYTNITLSSRLRSTSTAPRDFQVQYRVGEGDWEDVPDPEATIEITTDGSFPAGTISDVPLPAEVEDQESVSIRWLMTSNTSVNDGTVATTGRVQIDDIEVLGSPMPLDPPQVPQVLPPIGVQPDQFVANWEGVTGNVAGYELQVATSDQFLSEPTWFIDFDGVTKGNYNPGTETLSDLEWEFIEAMIGLGDLEDGVRSLRMRGYEESTFTLLEDLPDGLNRITFLYRRYGADNQVDWKVEYSVDEGESWTQIGDEFTAPDDDIVQTFAENVGVSDPARVRIVRATEDGMSENRRLNIDNIALFDVNSDDDLVAGYDPLFTVETSALVEGLDPSRSYYYRVRTVGQDDTRSDWSEPRSAAAQGTVLLLF